MQDNLSAHGVSGLVVRALTSDDWSVMRDLRLRALTTDPAAFLSTLSREEAFTEEVWRRRCGADGQYVAEIDGRAVGLAGLLWSQLPPQERTVPEIVSVWVDPSARRRGVAEALIDAVVTAARATGADEVALEVASSGGPAIALYEKLGFVRGPRPAHLDQLHATASAASGSAAAPTMPDRCDLYMVRRLADD